MVLWEEAVGLGEQQILLVLLFGDIMCPQGETTGLIQIRL